MNASADPHSETEPIIPPWAAPVYLGFAIFAALAYGVIDLIVVSMPGLAVAKVLGPALLAFYAAFSRAPILTLALILSACGDFMLALTPPAREAGIAFFGGAHLAYIALFVLVILQKGFRADGLILTVALIAFASALFVWLSPGMGPLRGPVSAYIGIIVIMAALAALMEGPRLITLGAVLFVVSDSLIAAGWFRGLEVRAGGWDLLGATIWTTYFLGQLGIAVGVVRLKRQEAATRAAS